MIYLNKFKTHASYESELNGGGVDFKIPNVSYCEDVKDVHYTPYNLVRFYVGEISETTPQTVKIYTDLTNFDEVQVSEEYKWYTYVLPKDKGLYKIEGVSVNKVVVKADITTNSNTIIPQTTVEASFKGSNTSKVTNMAIMFYNCSGLTSLDVSSFDTSNVTNMRHMFVSCSGLKSLDLSSFNTSKVTNMRFMFTSCSGLTSLDVSKFDTSKVNSMMDMFFGCNGLTELDISNFKTNNVTNMSSMFQNCSRLTTLDLSGWDMSSVTNTTDMFNGCTKLNTITMKGCSKDTIDKITAVKPSSAKIVTE